MEERFSLRKILQEAGVSQIDEKIRYLNDPDRHKKEKPFKVSISRDRGQSDYNEVFVRWIKSNYPNYSLVFEVMADKGVSTSEISTKISQQKKKGLDFIKISGKWLINNKHIDEFVKSFRKRFRSG